MILQRELFYLSPQNWCCFLSVISSFLKNPVLDILIEEDIFFDVGKVMKLTNKPAYITLLDNNEETNIPIRNSKTDTLIIAETIPPIYFTGEHGRVVLITNDSSNALSLWTKNRLLDVIILNIAHNKLEASTWFPYIPVLCHGRSKLEKIDTCSQLCTWNTNLFPLKIPKKFNGCAVSVELPSNVMTSTSYAVIIVEIAVFSILASSLDMTVNYLKVVNPLFYVSEENSPPTGAMHSITHGKCDFAIGSLVAHRGYSVFAKGLPSFTYQTYVWVLPTAKALDNITEFQSGFTPLTWMIIYITFVVCQVFVGALAYWKKDRWLWVDLFAQCFGCPVSKMPRNGIIKWFLLLIHFYYLHLNLFYSANLLHNLFNKPTERQLTSFKEAVDAGLTALLYPQMMDYVNQSEHDEWNEILKRGRHRTFYEPDCDLVVKDKTAFMLYSLNNNEYDTLLTSLKKSNPHLHLSEMVYIVKEPFVYIPNTIYGRRGSPITDLFYNKLLCLIDSGLLRIKSTNLLTTKVKSNSFQQALSLNEMFSKIIAHICGLTLTIFVFIIERRIPNIRKMRNKSKKIIDAKINKKKRAALEATYPIPFNL